MTDEIQDFDTVSVDQLDTITLALEQYLSVANVNGKLYKSKIGDLVTFIAPFLSAVNATGLVFPDGNNVLPTPNATIKGSIVGAGTFTWTGGTLTTTGLLNIIATNGTAWYLVKNIPTGDLLSKSEYNFGGTYTNIAAANSAIANTIVNGKNLRDGKYVYIGTNGTYIQYWWSGGFGNTNLVPITALDSPGIEAKGLGFYPIAQKAGLQTVENYPYSKGEAFMLKSGDAFPSDAASILLSNFGSELDLPALVGRKLTIEIIAETPEWFSNQVMDSILFVTKQNGTVVNVNPSESNIIGTTLRRFYYERTIEATDKSYETFWRIYSTSVAPSDSYFKTKDLNVFIDDVLYAPLNVAVFQDSVLPTNTPVFPSAINGAVIVGAKAINVPVGATGSGSKLIIDIQKMIPSYIDHFAGQKMEISFKIKTQNIDVSYLTLSFNSEQTIDGVVTANHTNRLSFIYEKIGGYNYAIVKGTVTFPSTTDQAMVYVQFLNTNTTTAKYLEVVEVTARMITGDYSIAGHFKSLIQSNNNLPAGTVNIDEFKDSFTSFNADGFNDDSALYKALKIYEFKNMTALISDVKPFKPVMYDGFSLKLNNVKLKGVKVPAFAEGMVSLTGGSIIQGCFTIFQTCNDVSIEKLGFDAMKNVSDAYYGSAETEGFVISYPAGTTEPWGRNFSALDIIAGTRSPYGAKHAFLIERVNGVRLQNVRCAFGQHGLAIKSKNVVAIGCASYGQSGENMIIKAGELTTNTSDVYVSDFVGDKMPPEVTSSFFTIPKVSMGVMFDAQIDLKNITIGSLIIKNATTSVHFKPLTAGVKIENVQIGSVYGSDGDIGLLRTGNGTVKNVSIGSAIIKNMLTFALDFEKGETLDSGIRIQTLLYRRDAGITPAAIYMNNNAKLQIGTLDIDNVTDALTINAGCELMIDNYVPNANVTNYKTAGMINPVKRMVSLNNADVMDGTIRGIVRTSPSGARFLESVDNSGNRTVTPL